MSNERNRELKLYAASKGVRLWQIAEKFGVADANFSRRLRKELCEADAEKFKAYVDEIANGGGENMKPRYMILLNDNPECHKCGMYHEAKRINGKNKVKETWGIQCGATKKIVHSKPFTEMEEELKRQCPILRIGLNDRIEGII